MQRRNPKKAFTLIELLVVIAIIAILAAILFPVFAQAREAARKSTCLSNEKQMALAVMMYKQDYDEFYPSLQWNLTTWNGWWYNIQPYTKNAGILVCPSATALVDINQAKLSNFPGKNQRDLLNELAGVITTGAAAVDARAPKVSYGFNESLVGGTNDAAVQSPAGKMMLADGAHSLFNYWDNTGPSRCGGVSCNRYALLGTQACPTGGYTQRHQGGLNMAFCDGHVKYIQADKYMSACPNTTTFSNAMNPADPTGFIN